MSVVVLYGSPLRAHDRLRAMQLVIQAVEFGLHGARLVLIRIAALQLMQLVDAILGGFSLIVGQAHN